MEERDLRDFLHSIWINKNDQNKLISEMNLIVQSHRRSSFEKKQIIQAAKELLNGIILFFSILKSQQ